MHTNNGEIKNEPPKSKPFPWRCGACGEKAVQPAVVAYTATPVFEGRKYTLIFPDMEAARCECCGELILPSASHHRITVSLIKAAGLLEPHQIREKMEKLGLSVEEFAEAIGAKKEMVAYWVGGGMLQPKSVDNLMRLYFELPAARAILNDHRSPAAPVPVDEETLAAESLIQNQNGRRSFRLGGRIKLVQLFLFHPLFQADCRERLNHA